MEAGTGQEPAELCRPEWHIFKSSPVVYNPETLLFAVAWDSVQKKVWVARLTKWNPPLEIEYDYLQELTVNNGLGFNKVSEDADCGKWGWSSDATVEVIEWHGNKFNDPTLCDRAE